MQSDLYAVQWDVFRFGNASGPRLTHIRERDIRTFASAGRIWVRAGREGISLLTWKRIIDSPRDDHVYRIAQGTILPTGLHLIDDGGGHYLLAPQHDMPLDSFRELLERLSPECVLVGRKRGSDIV